MSRGFALAIATIFFAFLAAPITSAFVVPSSETIENRSLAPFPEFEGSPSAFVRGLAGYVSDHMSARDGLVRLAASLTYDLTNSSPNPDEVILGHDGWLFLVDTFEEPCAAGIDPSEVVDGLRSLRESLIERGKEPVITIAPDKATVVSRPIDDKLARFASCSRQLHEQLVGKLREEDLLSVDLWNVLSSHPLPEETYFRTDSHLSHIGSSIWLDELMKVAVGSSPYEWGERPGTQNGNLMALIGLPRPEPTTVRFAANISSPTLIEQQHTRFSADRYATELWATDAPLVDVSAVILKDSFFDLSYLTLAATFRTTLFTDLRSDESIAYFAEVVDSFDVVIIESSEHSLWSRFTLESTLLAETSRTP